MPSRTSANAPAAASAPASARMRRLASASRPWTRNPPNALTNCGGEPEVTHDRDAALDEAPGHLDHPAAALQLDGVHAGPQEVGGIADRLGGGLMVRAEGHVADEELVSGTTCHGARVMQHLLHGDRQRGRVPEVVVADAVTDQERRHPGLGEKARDGDVVGGDHDEPFAALLVGAEVVDGDRHRRQATRGWATTLAGLAPRRRSAPARTSATASRPSGPARDRLSRASRR